MNDPYKYFMIEVDKLLENLNRDILEFEQKPDDSKLLNSLFRYAHTLKGAAHVVKLQNISKLAHSIENLFSQTRDQNIPLTAENISLILDTLDLIRNIIKAIKGGEPEDSIDIAVISERFEVPETSSQTKVKEKKGSGQKQPEARGQQKPGAKRQGTGYRSQKSGYRRQEPKTPGPKSKTSADTIRISLSDIDYLMDQTSELITGAIRMEQLYASLKDATKSSGRMLLDCRKIKSSFSRMFNSDPENGDRSNEFGALLQKIDMETLHSQLLEHIAMFDASVEELKQISDGMYRIVHKVKSIRISDMSHYFKGAVRELSQKLNKKLTLIIAGDDIELDRNLIEELREPVNQIIRNAAVHGIEDEAERLSKGKDPEGTIKLAFKKTGDFVHITLEDNGRGISPEKIKAAALKKGIIDEKKSGEISREESLYLIFASGVSSGKIITEFAGRGVGLDIVKNKVESLRGSINIETEEDKFCRFLLKLPLSLNMIDAFLIEASGQYILTPLNMVSESGYVSRDEIESVAGTTVIKLNNSPVSLVWMSGILGLDHKQKSQKQIPFVCLKSGHERMAFSVDQILGVQKIIIKGLGERLQNINYILGGSVLSSGRPALVLNVAELFKASMPRAYGSDTKISLEKTAPPSTPRILTVDDSLTTRVLISGVLEREGYDVTLASSGEDALKLLGNNNKYDLFTLDVEMPGINGFELASKIRNDPDHKNTPIIILSSLSKDEHRRKGIEVGAQAYILKRGFDQRIFLETVERLV